MLGLFGVKCLHYETHSSTAFRARDDADVGARAGARIGRLRARGGDRAGRDDEARHASLWGLWGASRRRRLDIERASRSIREERRRLHANQDGSTEGYAEKCGHGVPEDADEHAGDDE